MQEQRAFLDIKVWQHKLAFSRRANVASKARMEDKFLEGVIAEEEKNNLSWIGLGIAMVMIVSRYDFRKLNIQRLQLSLKEIGIK